MSEVIYSSTVIEMPVTDEVWLQAVKRGTDLTAKIRKANNRTDSILDGAGTDIAFLLEGAYCRYYGLQPANENGDHRDFNRDVIDRLSGITGEVKAKKRTFPVQPHWLVSVTNANTRQDASAYLFGSVYWPKTELRPTKMWLCGSCSPAEFFERATYGRIGEFDPTSSPRYRFTFRANCWNLPVFALRPPRIVEGSTEGIVKTITTLRQDVTTEGLAILTKFLKAK